MLTLLPTQQEINVLVLIALSINVNNKYKPKGIQ